MDDTVSAPVRNEKEVSTTSNKIIEEFKYLLEKSQQLFVGLRELPPTGRNWQPQFQRTFEVYTRIWKFQQQHRVVLENKDYYDLKRWEIGELASKIGQLYYHYYSKTSETNYLHESFVFYEAIRDRNYFKDVLEAKNAPLMVKKLRYIARFIVVCLLLNKADMVRTLSDSLAQLVEEYNITFKPSDYAEWKVVLSEISTFLEAEKKLSPIDFEGNALAAPTRVKVSTKVGLEKDGLPKLKLQEAILVGNYQNQIKFAELTLDMYRIMQSLERDPDANGGWSKPQQPPQEQQTTSGFGMTGIETKEGEDDKKQSRRSNPRKYMLYRPSFAQILIFLATCFKDISENSAILLYLSADGSKRMTNSSEYNGGVATAINISRKPAEKVDQDQNALVHTLHPHDLIPFTRKPLFLVVDSNNSIAFKDFPKVFSQPFVCFMSSVEYPSTIKDTTQIGSLFSLFLHCPIKAFAFISDITQVAPPIWEQGVEKVEQFEKLAMELVESDSNLDKSYKRFMQDDFLSQFIVRFIVTSIIVTAHSAFKEAKHFPSALPAFPVSILQHTELLEKAGELSKIFSVESLYDFNVNGSGNPPSEI